MDENREQSDRNSKNSSKFEFKKNCYEFPIELNQSDRTEALKCIDIAQAAFQESKYDKAERFLLKSLRICESEAAKLLLETLRNAQNKTNGNVEAEEHNEPVNNHPNEEMNKYSRFCKRATEAIAEGNLTKAEHFLSKAIRINPNDEAKKQLQHIRELRIERASNNEAITSKETVVTFAGDTKTGNDTVDKAHNYDEQELEKQQSEEMSEQMNKLNLKTREEVNQFDNFKPNNDLESTSETAEDCIERAKDLMKELKEKLKSGGNINGLMAETKKKITKGDSNVSQPEPKIKEVPREYISEIQRVEKANDDFGILGIQEGATLDEVDKAYKHLTKILHPDKNQAPGAEEAFMKVKDAKIRLREKQS